MIIITSIPDVGRGMFVNFLSSLREVLTSCFLVFTADSLAFFTMFPLFSHYFFTTYAYDAQHRADTVINLQLGMATANA